MFTPATTHKITYSYIEAKMLPAWKNFSLLAQTISQLTQEMLSEMSKSEFADLEREVKSHTGTSFESQCTHSMVANLVAEVKKVRPEVDNLNEALDLIHKDQLDQAVILLKTIQRTELQETKNKLLKKIAQVYRSTGQEEKADQIEGKSSNKIILETPSEKIVANAGKGLFHAGINNLKTVYPNNTLPSQKQFDSALDGLHTMSLISTCKERDLDLEKLPVKDLQQKHDTAEKELQSLRLEYDSALKTHDPDIFMPVLKKKQAKMQEILRLKSALHHNGVPQTESGAAEKIQEQFKTSVQVLTNQIKEDFPSRTKEEEEAFKKVDECVIS